MRRGRHAWLAIALIGCASESPSDESSAIAASATPGSAPVTQPPATPPPTSTPPAPVTPPPPPPPVGDPDLFGTAEADVVTVVRTADDRVPISPLLYGINQIDNAGTDEELFTWVRRGGDRSNAYDWETNVSNGSWNNDFANDMYLATELPDPAAPAGVDVALVTRGRAGGRGTMIPFVLNDYVAGPVASNIPWDTAGWNRDAFFHKVVIVKPTAFATTPDLGDGVVYTDEHMQFVRNQFPSSDIFAPGPSQVMVGIDNEPDLYAYNYPMLQAGTGAALYADNGTQVGTRVTGPAFTEKMLTFAKRVKALAPTAPIVGPDHFHFDGWTTWNGTMNEYSGLGRWFMDDFLETVRNESAAAGVRLLDTWDFHWYPQHVSNGTYVWNLDDSVRPLTNIEIDEIVQSSRSYWDTTYDEDSWITRDHLFGPAYIVSRLQDRLATGYPGTKLGVSEYFPGGCAHIASGLGVVDTLGVFARMGVHLAAMWPACEHLEYALGGIKLLRDADGAKTMRFADTAVKVEHPERAESSVFAGSDTSVRVTVVVVNKTNAPRTFGLRAFHDQLLTRVDTYRIDSAHASPTFVGQSALTKKNAYAYAAPPRSATLLVFRTP